MNYNNLITQIDKAMVQYTDNKPHVPGGCKIYRILYPNISSSYFSYIYI